LGRGWVDVVWRVVVSEDSTLTAYSLFKCWTLADRIPIMNMPSVQKSISSSLCVSIIQYKHIGLFAPELLLL